MQQRVTITLYHDVGHPDNASSKQSILQAFAEELPKALDNIKHPSAAFNWEVDAIQVDK